MKSNSDFGSLILLAVTFVASHSVNAQNYPEKSNSSTSPTKTNERLSSDKCNANDRAIKAACEKEKAQASVEQKYPNATRVEPPFPKTKIKKTWDALVKASTAKDTNALILAAEAVLSDADASVNERSESAYQVALAKLQLDKTSYSQPIDYAKKAIDFNGLNNNAHYQLMGVLSQMLMVEKQYVESLKYTDRLIQETGADDLSVNKTRGNALYRLERYLEASASLQKAYVLDGGADSNLATMLMDSYTRVGKKSEANKIADEISKVALSADPNDKSGQVKQLLVLANAKQYEKAAKIFDELYASGQIKQFNEYEAGYVSYSHLEGQESKAIKVINDGMTKGIIKPNVDVYNVLGQSYYYTENPKGAIEAWSKGAALSDNGELNMSLAQVLGEESKYAESKKQAIQALSKGIESKGSAYLLISQAESEFGLNNKPAMIAALREAAKYPESKNQALKLLKEAGVK